MSSDATLGELDGRAMCHFCGACRDDTEQVLITDESGGGTAHLCAGCRGVADSTRCGLCGEVKSQFAKAEHLVWAEGEESAPICDDCRRRALQARGGPT